MKHKLIAAALPTLAMFLVLLVSCTSEPKQEATPKSGNVPISNAAAGQAGAIGSVAGIEWKIPAGWNLGGQKPMRAATYILGSGDAPAECAVFFFGAGQGGEVEANIARWISQVKQPDGSESESKAVRAEVSSPCCKITTIEVAGVYQASSGPMMQVTAERPGYVLLGGIVPGVEGNVFFKLTGPKEVVASAKEDFLGMLRSVAKQAD